MQLLCFLSNLLGSPQPIEHGEDFTCTISQSVSWYQHLDLWLVVVSLSCSCEHGNQLVTSVIFGLPCWVSRSCASVLWGAPYPVCPLACNGIHSHRHWHHHCLWKSNSLTSLAFTSQRQASVFPVIPSWTLWPSHGSVGVGHIANYQDPSFANAALPC